MRLKLGMMIFPSCAGKTLPAIPNQKNQNRYSAKSSVEKIDRKGNILHYTYDTINMQRTEKTFNPDNVLTSSTETDYGQYGTPVRITGKDGADNQLYMYEYTCDGLGQVTRFDQHIGEAGSSKHYSVENLYNKAGQLNKTWLRDESGATPELIRKLDYAPNDPDFKDVPKAVSRVKFCDNNETDILLRTAGYYWGRGGKGGVRYKR